MEKVRDLTADELDAFAGIAARIQLAQRSVGELQQKHQTLVAKIEAECDGGRLQQTDGGAALFKPGKKPRKKAGGK